ncbi:MAG: Bro-N domain-containing protein [Nanoarchaeota archaeon]|nr:Bro-N domain-containing protein [Nanoarchaeota archaeon]MBU4451911.1 Bro-N domain-containing protein [Nanoarchaeota archaeon]MCG2724604.1 Bro-N domain-containing protein [archaeon]
MAGHSAPENALVVFQGKAIRRVWHDNEWFFSVVDIIQALTDSANPRNYWNMLKSRESEHGVELYTICVQLKLLAEDGKLRETDCVNTQGAFRIIQSIPSLRAEPFKQWLAKVGYERVQEIENPEIAMKRMREIYAAKGYSDDWIEKRVRGIAIRDELTNEWGKRGVKADREYAILTAEISKATFGLTPSEYKKAKGLENENLRDHMNDLELIFSMLGERLTTEATRKKDARGFIQNQIIANEGGSVAGRALNDAEKSLGIKIVSNENFIELNSAKKLEKKLKQ